MKSSGQSLRVALQRLKTYLDRLRDARQGLGSASDRSANPAAALNLIALEDRVLFDAVPLDIDMPDVVADADPGFTGEPMDDGPLSDWAFAELPLDDFSHIQPGDRLEYLETLINTELDQLTGEASDYSATELLVIDVSIDHWQAFVADIVDQPTTRMEVVLIDAGRNGVSAVGSALERLGQVDAVHVLSHGEAGRLQLGSVVVAADTLSELDPRLRQWQDNLAPDADLLLYGCNLASNDEGTALLVALAETTGADVAASQDLTGHAALGGDWVLEYSTGTIESSVPVSAELQDHWVSLLPAVIDPDVTTGPWWEFNVTDRDARGSGHAVAMDGDGNYMIVWSRYNGGAAGWDVYGQYFDPFGNSAGEFRVNENQFGDQQYASVAADADGNFVVVWSDVSLNDVEARIFHADGSDSGEFDIHNDGFNPSVAMNDAGHYAVVWQRGDERIYASLFDADGTTIRNAFRVDSGSRIGAEDADVAMDELGNLVVVWETDNGITTRRFDDQGDPLGNANPVFSNAGSDSFHNPSIGLRSDGSFVVLATANFNGDVDVLGAIVQPDNSQAVFTISETTTNWQLDASISVNTDDSFVVTWHGYGNQPNNSDSSGIFYRTFDASGDGGNELRVNDYTSGTQHYASVASLDNETFVVVWSGRTATQDNGIGLKQFLPEIEISGTIYHDIDADGQYVDDGASFSGVNVLLYRDTNGDGRLDAGDTVSDATTTDGDGFYEFVVSFDGNYFVVVDSRSIGADQDLNFPYSATDLWAEQTWGAAGSLVQGGFGQTFTSDRGALFGGRSGDGSDDLGSVTTMEHVTRVVVAGREDVRDVDSAFSFNVVTHTGGGELTAVSGQTSQGSLRQFLINANALAGANHMRFVPATDPNESARQTWRIDVSQVLPIIQDRQTTIDGQAWSASDGNIQIDGDPGLIGIADATVGAAGYDLAQIDRPELELYAVDGPAFGLHVDADEVTINGLRVEGFGSIGDPDSANIVVHNVDDFRLTDSQLAGAGQTGLIVEGGRAGQVLRNVISGSASFGIRLHGQTDPVSDWLIQENFILGNGTVNSLADGIDVQFDGANNEISRNWIAGNRGSGIDSYLSSGGISILDNTISGNGLGGNETANIRLFGDDSLVRGNVIRDAAGSGVLVLGSSLVTAESATGNMISENEFGGNGGLAIDLTAPSLTAAVLNRGDGLSDFTGNPAGAGNDGMMSPVIASTTLADGITTVRGTAGAGQRVEVYQALADADGSDDLGGSSYGEGVRFLGWVLADGSGNFEFACSDLLAADSVVAIAIDGQGNTSEFSQNREVNVAPTAEDFSVYLAQGASLVVDPGLFEFSDADGDALVGVYVDTPPANVQLLFNGSPVAPGQYLDVADLLNGSLRVEVPIGVAGQPVDIVEFRVFDGAAASQTVTVQIHVANLDPVFDSADTIAIGENTGSFVVMAHDPDGGPIVYRLTDGNDDGLFTIDSATGLVTFNQPPNFEDPHDTDRDNIYRIQVIGRDLAGGETTLDLSIQVTDVNEPVSGLSLSANQVAEMEVNGTLIGVAQVEDPDVKDSWYYELLDDADGRFSIDSATGQLRVADGTALDFEQAVAHQITIKVTDAAMHSLIVDFVIEVTDLNEWPVAADQMYDVDEAGKLLIDPAEWANVTDPDGDPLTYSVVSAARHGTVQLLADGTIVYQHDGSETTSDSFQYQAADGRGGFDTATISIDVNPVNDAPVANSDLVISTSAGSFIILPGQLLNNDFDVDSANLSIFAVGLPSEGTLHVNPDGSLTYTPAVDGSGQAIFRYVITDGQSTSQPASVRIIFPLLPDDRNQDPVDSGDDPPAPDPGIIDRPDVIPGNDDDGTDDNGESGIVDSDGLGADTENNGIGSSEFGSAAADDSGDGLNTIYDFSYQKSEIVVSSLFLQAIEQNKSATFESTYASALATGSIWQDLDKVSEELLGNVSLATGTVKVAASLTGVFTVGYVFWMARGGMLVASLVSSTTAWRSFDPLPILQYAADHENSDDDDSLQSLMLQE